MVRPWPSVLLLTALKLGVYADGDKEQLTLYTCICLIPMPGGHFSFVCTGVCGHTIEKLTHPQIKAGLSINKNRPIPRLRTIKHDPKLTELQQVLFSDETTHSQVELLKW